MKLTHCMMALGVLIITGPNLVRAADRHVPANYASIQAAVNAAVSGDTIHIAPGIYVEQTRITNKNLTLIGQPGTILRAFAGMAPGIPGVVRERSLLFIRDSSFVTLRNLRFEGDQLGGENEYALLGVNFEISGGSVEHCRFTGFRERTPGSVGGAAILFWNGLDGASRYQAKVSGTTIEDCYSGIFIYGAKDVISYDVAVVDNTITGVGLTTADDFLQGIHTDDGTTGIVARNTISGFAYDGPVGPDSHSIPFGILRLSRGFPNNTLALPPMTFEDNVLRDNQVHLASFIADNSIVRNNTFETNVPLTEEADPPILEAAAGLWFSGANVQVIGNRFSNLEQGIRLAAQGDFLGDATDAMLVDNRYCDVATKIVTEPGATYTEQGALTCPYPDPVLSVTKAVLLHWPKIEEGFVVECAPTPDGPWTALNATMFLQDGRHAVSVPTGSGQKFFRLFKP